jgi:pimeloyl-ACP methyl ester carboxylesterase
MAGGPPAAQESAKSAPILFVHGTADILVPIKNVLLMANDLTRLRVPAKVVPIAEAGHWPLTSSSGVGPQKGIVRSQPPRSTWGGPVNIWLTLRIR